MKPNAPLDDSPTRDAKLTIAALLKKASSGGYLRPVTSRSALWKPPRMLSFLTAAVRGDPTVPLLLRPVDPLTAQHLDLWRFAQYYTERDSQDYSAAEPSPGHGATIVLDGVQRVTALNITVHGVYAQRRDLSRWHRPDAYPEQRVYLNLLDDLPGGGPEFRFLAALETLPSAHEPGRWYPVIWALQDSGSPGQALAHLERHNLAGSRRACERVLLLWEALHIRRTVDIVHHPDVPSMR